MILLFAHWSLSQTEGLKMKGCIKLWTGAWQFGMKLTLQVPLAVSAVRIPAFCFQNRWSKKKKSKTRKSHPKTAVLKKTTADNVITSVFSSNTIPVSLEVVWSVHMYSSLYICIREFLLGRTANSILFVGFFFCLFLKSEITLFFLLPQLKSAVVHSRELAKYKLTEHPPVRPDLPLADSIFSIWLLTTSTNKA